MPTKHLIIATYDGIASHYCGVGTIARNLVTALSGFPLNDCPKVSIAYIHCTLGAPVYDAECHSASLRLVERTGGYLLPLENGTTCRTEWDMWAGFAEWDAVCASLVTALNGILIAEEDNLLLLNDTPFLMFTGYRQQVNCERLRCVYFPLSTGMNHAFGDRVWREQRILRERTCFALIRQDPAASVIALGFHFAGRMKEDYQLHFTDRDYLQNGLCFSAYTAFLEKRFTNADLTPYGIHLPADARIVFSWGRCSVAKGFRELAEAWLDGYELLPDHYLILQVPNNSGEDDYFQYLADQLTWEKRAMVINDFNPDIWKTILRNLNTAVVCIPSVMDPFPHTAIEAKLFCRDMNYVPLVSDVDGAVDAFGTDEALFADPRRKEAFVRQLLAAANMNAESRLKMIRANEATIGRFNFPVILKRFLSRQWPQKRNLRKHHLKPIG